MNEISSYSYFFFDNALLEQKGSQITLINEYRIFVVNVKFPCFIFVDKYICYREFLRKRSFVAENVSKRSTSQFRKIQDTRARENLQKCSKYILKSKEK